MSINPDDSKQLYDSVLLAVRGGYDSRETIIENEIALWRNDWQGDNFDTWKRHIAYTVDMLLKQHLAEQRTWLHETDCEKLDDAFAELDLNGIVARQNWTCCQTCGHTDMAVEIDDVVEYRPIRGYVFFHQQDTERVTESDYLYLAYGSRFNDDELSLHVAQEIVDTLRKHGLAVEWNGMIQKRICIKEIHWQRRRLPENILALDS